MVTVFVAGLNLLEIKKGKFISFIYASNPLLPRERFSRVKNVIFTAPYFICNAITENISFTVVCFA